MSDKISKPDSDANSPNRRKFLAAATTVAIGGTCAVAGGASLAFLRPRVTYGSISTVRVGRPDSYSAGNQVEFAEAQVVVRREGERFAAISTICTHLGCTVGPTDIGFDCPCHGSSYDYEGNVIGGPAPDALAWYRVTLTPTGELEVDTRRVVPQGTYLRVES